MQDFRKLDVWHQAHRLTLKVYRCTRSFPKDELYGLTSQLRRSSASIGANIAEGCGRSSTREFSRFLQIALGSANEVEYHLILARDLEYCAAPDSDMLVSETQDVQRMLGSLLKRVNTSNPRTQTALPNH